MANDSNQGTHNCKDREGGGDVDTIEIAVDVQTTRTVLYEALFSKPSDVCTHSRVTLKGVTYTPWNIRTGQQIGFMHPATVATTGSWSCPGKVSNSFDQNRHGVLGLDRIDEIPGNRDLFGWIDNLQALIEDQNVRFEKEQIGTDSPRSTHTDSQGEISTVEQGLNDESDKEEDKNPATGYRTSRSEFFTVRHCQSFSQLESII